MHEAVRRRLGVAVGVLLVVGLLAARLVPPAVVVLSLPFLYLLAAKPVLRRLALGHIARRPRETALVLLGSLLGTAIITSSFVVGDTLEASISRSIHTQLGPLDAVVTAPGGLAEVEAQLAAAPPTEIDGVLPMTSASVTVAAGPSEAPRAEPGATVVEVDFDRARSFGGDPDATGISGRTPATGEAVLGEDLATTLEVAAGGTVRLYAYGAEQPLEVIDVLPQKGLAGYRTGNPGSASPTLFVAPGTIEAMAAAAPDRGEPPLRFLAVSAAGGVEAVADDSSAFERAIDRAITSDGANVVLTKYETKRAAKAVGDSFTQLFGMVGLFSVLAGLLLLVNIFVMLAQERQSELGMLRAVGLRRSGLVGSFSLEGWMYAIASSALGTIVGLGVGRIIVGIAANLFSGGGPAGQGGLDLYFAPSPQSLSVGFFLGFVISLVTVVITSLRISRLNVIRAIRELPEPTVKKRRPFALVAAAVAVVLGATTTMRGLADDGAQQVLVGPVLFAVGAAVIAGRFLPRRVVVSLASAAVLFWAVMVFALFPDAFRDAAIAVFVTQGVILVASAVALLSQNQEPVGHALRRVGGGAHNMALRLGLAYPLARVFRTSMTLAMYALVVYMLATITVFSHLFGAQIDRFTASISGGFDVIAESNGTNPIPVEELRAVPGVEHVAPIASAFGEYTPMEAPRPDQRGATGPTGWPAASFDETFLVNGPPALETRSPEFATDEDAYRAVLANPDLFIPTGFFLEQGGGPPQPPEIGERYVLRDPLSGGSRVLTVAAVAQSGFGSVRPLMSQEALRSIFGNRAQPNVFYVNAAPGADVEQLATEINGRFVASGANAQSFVAIVEENLSQQQGFFRLMRGYLALGLVVGIAGLGVVMVRAVRERRREIGVLRALGFDPAAVRRAFLVESAFVALEGILTGTALAVVTTWRLASNADFGAQLRYEVPWVALFVLVLLTIVASLLATAAPAQQASRIRPAVALRIAD